MRQDCVEMQSEATWNKTNEAEGKTNKATIKKKKKKQASDGGTRLKKLMWCYQDKKRKRRGK